MADIGTILTPGSNVDMAELRDWLAAPDQRPEGTGSLLRTATLTDMDGSSQTLMTFSEFMTALEDQNVGHAPFVDNYVFGFGWNMGPSGTRVDTGKGGFSDRMERSYFAGGKMAFERHIQVDPSNGDDYFRPFSIFAAHDGSYAAFSSEVDSFSINQRDGSRQIQFDLASGFTNYSDAMTLRFAGNNDPVVQQMNFAGNAYLDLPLINARNEIESRQATYLAADPVTNVFAVSAHVTRNLLNPVAGGFGEHTIAGNVTGDYTMTFRQVSASGALIDQLVNTHATGRIVRSLIATGGDVMEVFQIGGNFAGFGHHASSGELRFGFYNDLVNNIGLKIAKPSDGYLATFSGPVKFPSFTVGTLPSASGSGAGSMIFVTDETGGAVPAFSDGTNWRRVTDRVVVS